MRSLKLKKLEIKDDIPLYVTLYCKEPWKVDESGDIKSYKPVVRDSNCYFETPIYSLGLNPSSSKGKIVTLLEYFFKVCDVDASPQCTWKTDDCDYMSLLLSYTIRLNLILYVIKYWINFQNRLCQKIVLKKFQTMEKWRIILLQLKLHIQQPGQQSMK